MKIVFLLACEGTNPGGGHKVIYEYANHLAARGHEVWAIHFASAEPRQTARTRRGLLRPFRYISLRLKNNWRPDRWFKLHPAIKAKLAPILSSSALPEADAYIATWWSTAESLAEMERFKGKRFYLIQHLETWAGGEKDVMATWRAPLQKIVIARWLEQIAQEIGEESHYIPNGLDFDKFGQDTAFDGRDPKRLAMLFNTNLEWKGTNYGIEAARKVKEIHPDFEAEFFGVQERPEDLPRWITYHQNPAQDELRRIYNRIAIFLSPSLSEGWGLPPSEAMTCGASVIATDIGGHREFCIDDETALLVPVRDSDAIASAVCRLIDDQQLRLRIARNGHKHIHQFTWSAATDAFEQVLRGSGR